MLAGDPIPHPVYLPFPAWLETKNRIASHLEDRRKLFGDRSREWEEKEQVRKITPERQSAYYFYIKQIDSHILNDQPNGTSPTSFFLYNRFLVTCNGQMSIDQRSNYTLLLCRTCWTWTLRWMEVRFTVIWCLRMIWR